MKRPRNTFQQGVGLLDAVFGAFILSLIVLAAAATLVQETVHRKESLESYQALIALRDFVEEIQAVANMPENLEAGTGVSALYKRYHGKRFGIDGLLGGLISVTCCANETTVPVEFGGIQDLNLDGDAQDDLSPLAGTDLRIVPMKVTLSYVVDRSVKFMTAHRLVTRTTD